jgi:MoxR-like ATPase
MLKVKIAYPTRQEEQLIIRSNVRPEGLAEIKPVVTLEDITKAKQLARAIYLDEKIERYIVAIVHATRFPVESGLSALSKYVAYGASPRASINLALAAKAQAFLDKRGFVIPDDVRNVAMSVLRHRVGVTYEAEADGVTSEQLIEAILQRVEVP